MREASRRARRLASALPWIAAGIGAVLLAGVGVRLGQDLQRELEANANRARILADGTAEAVSRRIEGLDFALTGLAARIDPAQLDNPAHVAAVHAALVQARDLSRDTNAFVVLDRTGRLVATSRVPPERTERVSLADRPLFAPIAADPAPRLSISPPYLALLGNVQDRPIIAVGRPLFDRDGGFAGVVTAILPTFDGRGLLPPIDLPDNVAVALLRGDSVLLEQRPASPGLPRQADLFALPDALGRADPPTSGLFRSVRADDGEAFLAAWHVVDRGRAVVLVGLKRSAVVGIWARTAVPVGLAGALLAAALLLLAVRLSRTIGQLDAALADLALRERETSAIADALGIGLWVRRGSQARTEYRGAFAQVLTGKPLAVLEAEPNAWRKYVVHPDDGEGLKASYRGSDLTRGWRHEYRVIAADGSVHWVEDRAIQVPGAQGDGPVYGAITDITEIREARERLSRQERQIADAVRLAGLAFWRLPAGSDRFEWCTESYRQFGVDPLGFEPRLDAILPMIEPDDRPHVAETLRRVRETGESESYIYRFRRADGALRVRWSLTGVERDESGRVIALAGVSQDITDRERMHAALTQQQLQLAEAGRVAGLGFWRLRKGAEVLEWTDAVYAQMGETRESFVPTLDALYQRILPEDRETTRAAAERVWQTGEPGSVVYRIRRPDGEIRFRWVSIALERDAEGAPIAVSGISQDITEQRLATERLARQERQIAEAGRIAKIGFYRRDLATGAIDCTAEFLAQHGLAPDAAPGFADLRALVHRDDVGMLDQLARRVIETGETAIHTYRIIRPDGVIRRLRATIGLERALDGSPAAISGLFQDVTEEVEAREQRDRQQQFLEAARRIGRLNYWRLPLDSEEYTWTDTLFEEYGVDRATFVPTRATVFAMIHPDDRQAVLEAGQHLRRTGEGATTTFRIIRPDGSIRWRRAVSGLERNAEGVPAALIGVTQDVTDERAGREQLERQQRYLEAARRVGHVGFYWRAIDSDTYTWTEEIYAGYGVDPQHFTPTRAAVRAMTHPEDLAVIDAASARLLDVGESGTVTYRIIRPDGAVRWRRATAGIERGPDGAPIGLVGVSQDVTEEVERREQLERQQHFLDAARRIGRIGFYRRPLDGSPSTWTEEIYRDFGVDPATFTPTRDAVMAMVHPEDRDELRAWMGRVGEGSESRGHTYRLIRADGQLRWRRVLAGLERRADGTPMAVVGVAQDVTEEMEGRQQLERQQRFLEAARRVGRIGFFRRPLDGGPYTWTEEIYRDFGVDPASFTPTFQTLMAMIHPDDRAQVEASIRRAVAEGESGSHTYRIIRPDGQVRWRRVASGLERRADGTPIAVIGVAQDVTEEVEAREQIAEQARRLREVGRVAHIGFYRRALDGTQMVATEEKLRQFGLPPDSGPLDVGAYRALIHPDDVPRVEATGRRIVETGESETVTFRVCRPDGTVRWVRIVAGLERDADGQKLAVTGLSQDVTDEVEAAEQLRQRDKLLADAGRVARLGFWRRRLDEETVVWSDEVYRFYGFEPGGVVPTLALIRARMHPDDLPVWQQARTRLHETGENQTVTVRVRQADGSWRWIRDSVGRERAADGVVTVYGIAQDVTAEIEAVERLRHQDRLLADAGRVARLGFWGRRLDSDVVTWSDEVYRQFGLEPGSIAPTNELIAERLHPDDRAVWNASRTRLRETGDAQTVTVRVRRADGGYRWIRNSSGMERGSDGVMAVFGITQDVTEEVEARERLDRQQRQLADAGRVAGLGFWRLPLGGAAFELSEAIYDQIGADPRLFTASVAAVLALMPPEDQDVVRATLDRVAATGEQASMSYRIRRSDGAMRHRSSTVGLERAADGTPVALVGVSTDITERVEQEERLERAQRLNALGELTGGIAHDVNNLLSVIGLNLELVHELVPDGEPRELTDAALHAVGQGAKLTRGLLAFAQRQSLRPAPVPLAPLIGGLDALLRRALGGRIVLRTDVAPDTPPALVDAAQLETSLVNLVLNARDAMPEGGQVTIRAARASPEEVDAAGLPERTHVRIAVEDEGQGMTPEVLARAFEPFFTTKGAGKGTGLGLAMVYGFAHQSGGEVRIDSTEGAGTTVTLWLPIAEEEAGPGELRAADHAVLRGARLLVVEDEAPLRALVARLCREAGMEVSAVADADAALALLRYGVRVDLLLSDIRMPGRLDGHALAAEARALRPGLPAVLMTGFDDSVAGDVVVPQLRKPFTRADLLDALAAALRVAQAAAQ